MAFCASLMGLGVFTSCIREALPNINVDVTEVSPAVVGSGVVKTTLQENGVTVYVDMQTVDLKNLPLNVMVSEGATLEYVDVEFKTTYQTIEYGGQTFTLANVDTIVTPHEGQQMDFSETRYVKVRAEAVGIRPEDKKTALDFNKFNGLDEKTGQLFKIWSIQVLPANLPSKLSFDKWYNPYGRRYQHPYENVTAFDGSEQQINIWASTNNSLGILLSTIYGDNLSESHYGSAPTDDAVSGKALVLTTKDISLYDKTKPYVAGCMFIGEFDGTDGDALTCTHVGLPFNQLPDTFKLCYKYLPNKIASTGELDKGFMKAVLYRTDANVPFLTGKTIRDNEFPNTIAYAEFYPDQVVDKYTELRIPFTYIREANADDAKNWKYNLAIYFASSKEGFKFVGAGDTKLFVDEIEIICKK